MDALILCEHQEYFSVYTWRHITDNETGVLYRTRTFYASTMSYNVHMIYHSDMNVTGFHFYLYLNILNAYVANLNSYFLPIFASPKTAELQHTYIQISTNVIFLYNYNNLLYFITHLQTFYIISYYEKLDSTDY